MPTLDEPWNVRAYQTEVAAGIRGDGDDVVSICTLGMFSSGGKVVQHIHRLMFDDGNLDEQAFVLDAGDMLWYLTALLSTLDVDLNDVVERNVVKTRIRNEGKESEAFANRVAEVKKRLTTQGGMDVTP